MVSFWPYRSNWSGVTSRNGCSLVQAALFTSRSMGPTSFRAASVAAQSARSTHTGTMAGLWRGAKEEVRVFTFKVKAERE